MQPSTRVNSSLSLSSSSSSIQAEPSPFDEILENDRERACAAALNLSEKSQNSDDLTFLSKMEATVDRAIQKENLQALELMIQYELITVAKMQEACQSKDSIFRLYATLLTRDRQDIPGWMYRNLLEFLLSAGLHAQALEKYHSLFDVRSLSRILTSFKPTMLKSFEDKPQILSLFVKVLQEALVNNRKEFINFFKEPSFLSCCFNQALHEKNGIVIRHLLNRALIETRILKEKIQNADSRPILIEQFKICCENVSEYPNAVTHFLQADIPYDEQDIGHVVKAGKYYVLLQQFQAKGADIASPIFDLVRNGQTAVLTQLLDYQTPAILPSSSTPIRGLDPNFRNQAGKTLLIEAVEQDQQRIVELLLGRGANPLILSPDGRTVFQLAKDKKESVRQLLYNPELIPLSVRHFDQGASYSSENLSAEETVLRQYLDRRCQGKAAANYYPLFIKVKHVVLAVLRERPFSKEMRANYQEAYFRNRQNFVHCWACPTQSGRYPIPQDLIPSQTTMHTIAFAIRQVQSSLKGEEIVSIPTQGSSLSSNYSCKRIDNTYKAKNPSQEHGFKYAYEGIQIHGHGKNPEAAHKAFLEHYDEVNKLSYRELKSASSNETGTGTFRWTAPPDLTQEIVSLQQIEKERQKMFEQEKDHQQKLDQLAQRVSTFLTKIEAVVESRYIKGLSQTTLEQEECQKMHRGIIDELAYLPVYIRSTNRVQEWKSLIQRQIRGLNLLEKKLVEVKSWDSTHVDNETKVLSRHLQDLLDLAVKNPVTSADQPTLKICFSSEIISNIFVPTPDSTVILKKAICRLIGANLVEIALLNQANLLLRTLLQQQKFREKIEKQFEREAQFFVNKDLINDPGAMQELAGHLALFHDTSRMLEYMPPISSLTRVRNERVQVENQTFSALFSSYKGSREILDRFWQIVCFEESALSSHLDDMMELLHQRLLLIDQENRQEEKDHHIYLHIDARDPKHLLDKQLFLLQTALLMAFGQPTPPPQPNSTLTSIVELVQLRLKPNLYGNDRKKSSSFRFFIGSVREELLGIRDIVGTAYQSSSSMQTSLQTLKDLLMGYEFPDKKTLEDEMNHAFQSLTSTAPFPKFDPALLSLIDLAGKVKEEIKTILGAYREEIIESEKRVEGLQMSLTKTSKVLDPNVSDSPSALESLRLLNAISQNQTPDKGEIEKVCLSDSDQQVRSCIGRLQKVLKERLKLKSDPKIEEGKREDKQKENTTKFQQAIASLITPIQVYIEIKKQFSASVVSYKENCLKILTQLQLDGLEEISQKLPHLIEMVKEKGTDDFEVALKLKGFANDRKTFLEGSKGKAHADKYLTKVEELKKQTEDWLKVQLPSLLQELLTSAEECQKIFYGEYIKQLSKANERLKLGIHSKTYYTAQNGNRTYYLWDGEKFSATPYHTANETHIPIPEIPLQATHN